MKSRSMCRVLGCAAAGITALAATAAQAAQIGGSAGSVVLVGNAASGSFSVQVDYSAYNGLDAADPLGVTADIQLVFQMTHLGTGGTAPVLDVGRLTVFAPAGAALSPFYSSITSIPQGGTIAPSTMDIDPPPGITNRGEFFFEVLDINLVAHPDFSPGDVSDWLVLTTPRGQLPGDVVIEANRTETGLHADTIIRLVPEPSAASLLLVGAAALLRRRSR